MYMYVEIPDASSVQDEQDHTVKKIIRVRKIIKNAEFHVKQALALVLYK